tara:strand:- start:1789 stop:2709 length:921 start_codon:yes stop_codon:yes gene_type:complete
MNILITGVAGFIGSRVAQRFISEGHKVVGIDNLSGGKLENIPKEVEFLNINLIESSSISKIPKNLDLILHLAGQSSGEISFHNPIEDLNKNTTSCLNLIKYGIENKIKKFIFASSMSVYGDIDCLASGVKETTILEPKSCYGISKLSSERYLNVFKNQLPYLSLRMFNVYGPGQDMENMRQGMVSIFLSQAIKNKKIVIKGSLYRFRDFIYIDDVVECWYQASLNEKVFNQAINIGTGRKTTVKQIIEMIKTITNVTETQTIEGTPCDQLGIFSNNKKLTQILNITPKVDLMNGLKIFYEWSKENY